MKTKNSLFIQTNKSFLSKTYPKYNTMTADQQIALIRLFADVNGLLTREMDKLLESGIEPDIDGNHPDERWQTLIRIQSDKESFEDNYEILGKDGWSFESKLKVGRKRKEELLERIREYKKKYC
jgi:hypothetical protein